ncbi:hypothetical protein AMTRI_Chr05g61440 [Amborella trichopoda]
MSAQLTALMPLIFNDNDLPTDFDRCHNWALYITVYATGHTISRVLIDNGLALNICLVRTFERIGIDLAFLKSSQLTITAYDGSKRQAKCILPLALTIGPISQIVRFHVSDIDHSFNLLLGRPWHHENLAIASTLHQCLKIPTARGIVTVFVDHPQTINLLDLDQSWSINDRGAMTSPPW